MDFSKHSDGTTSVKVHNAPGGKSNFSLAWDQPENPKPAQKATQPPPPQQVAPNVAAGQKAGGVPQTQQTQQSTDAKTSVKVHNPPGGKSSISFG